MKELLRAIFAAVLRELDVQRCLTGAVGAALRQLAADGPLVVFAIGKAAQPMAQGLCRELAAHAHCGVRGIVVAPTTEQPLPGFAHHLGGHPLPNAASFAAGQAALALAASIAPNEHAVFLLSGGGSALLEAQISAELTADNYVVLHRYLIGSGADIRSINAVRRAFSGVKGGRLALAAQRAKSQCTLLVSDVPDDDLPTIASGPTCAEPRALPPTQTKLWRELPSPFAALAQRRDLPTGLTADHPLLQRATFRVLLSERAALAAARRLLSEAGFFVVPAHGIDDLPYPRAAERLLALLQAHRRQHRRVAVVTTGECVVTLPSNPGCGGRNQQLALQLALRCQGLPITALSCGTDGIDGNSPAAGAVIDGSTCRRARAAGVDPVAHLARCDAFPLFDAIGDCVQTGPTGTNVRDLRMLLWTN